jgi:hypothetical protein
MEKKDARLIALIERRTMAAIRRESKRSGVSVAEVVRRALAEHLRKK